MRAVSGDALVAEEVEGVEVLREDDYALVAVEQVAGATPCSSLAWTSL